MSELSTDCEIADEVLTSPTPAKKAKTCARDTINSFKISVLMSSHGVHYNAWSGTRKKAGKQLIPKEIWPKVS